MQVAGYLETSFTKTNTMASNPTPTPPGTNHSVSGPNGTQQPLKIPPQQMPPQQMPQQQMPQQQNFSSTGESPLSNSTNYPSSGHVTSESGATPYGNGPSATPSSAPGSGTAVGAGAGEFKPLPQGQPKRLHVSNIPFRFREPDLRQLFYVSRIMYCIL